VRRISIAAGAIALLLLVDPAWAATTAASWAMDETSGTTMSDSSGNANNGTTYNVTMGVVGPAVGTYQPSGTAYQFVKTSQSHVVAPSSASLNPGDSDTTIAVYINTTSTNIAGGNGDWDLIRKGAIYKAEIYPYNGRALANCHFKGTAGAASIHGGPALNDGAWHLIVCTKTSSSISVAVDRTTVGSKQVTIGSMSSSAKVVLGYKSSGADYYDGLMDDVTISYT
jgi:hypothetical protein